ncbi:MAG: ceramidase domain-containing protein [Paracoccaceae bacterium]|nr:ceramidase domain-containing protein [Paracoccaceae bacterium]
MDWFQQVDIYCERTDFSYWSEPLNALTNLFYLIGAIWAAMRNREPELGIARTLAVLLGCIAVGSFLFHTHATQWAATADVTPIGLFILTYLFAVNRDVMGMRWWVAAGATLLFLPYAAALVPVLDRLPFFQISNFYWTVPILIAAYAPFVARRAPETARGMLIGAGILTVSITLRSLDLILCEVWPVGTHIFWHTLNAIMLPWMIEVYRRHRLRAAV